MSETNFRRTDFQNVGCFEKLMVSTLQETSRDTKKNGKPPNCAGKQVTPHHSAMSQ